MSELGRIGGGIASKSAIARLGVLFHGRGQPGSIGDYMRFLITIVQDEDGIFVAECPSIPGCIGQGKTEIEAEKNIKDAIKACLEVRAEQGLPLTVTTREVEVQV